VYNAHNKNKIQYSDIDVCWWTPSVNDTLFLLQKVHQIKEQQFIRAGFAIPEGALLTGFHSTTI